MTRFWFVSHPSGGPQHTPIFFDAVNQFAAQHANVKLILPHAAQEDVHLTKEDISKSELVLVEVSIPSTGSGIELGWANAAGKPIYAFHQGGTNISPAIKFVATEINAYVTADHIVKALETLL